MVERVSALNGHYRTGRLGDAGTCGVTLLENKNLSLIQLAAWPDTLNIVSVKAAQMVGVGQAPGPGRAEITPNGSLMRIEPLKWWLVGAAEHVLPSVMPANQGAVLNLSHSRVWLSISGPQAALFLNRHLPLDLRGDAFPVGTVASTAFHHTGVTLWRSEHAFELLVNRGFALSLWTIMLESAAQFNAEVI